MSHVAPAREVSMLFETPAAAPQPAPQRRDQGRLLREVPPGAAAVEPTLVLSNGRYNVSLRANGADIVGHVKSFLYCDEGNIMASIVDAAQESALREARQRAPESRDIRYHLAWALHRSGQRDAARSELAAARDGAFNSSGLHCIGRINRFGGALSRCV